MDYVVGSVAALISGNVTPVRPKVANRALTPIKRKPSPNVTPKSALVNDRSALLSPSVQKKRDLLKKSPKRIFQNLDTTNDNGNTASVTSPKVDKVKKQLQSDLNSELNVADGNESNKKKKKNRKKSNEFANSQFENNSNMLSQHQDNITKEQIISANEEVSSKKRKLSYDLVNEYVDDINSNASPRKKNSKNKSNSENKELHSNVSPHKVKIVEDTINKSKKNKNHENKEEKLEDADDKKYITVSNVIAKKNKKKSKAQNDQNRELESEMQTNKESEDKKNAKNQLKDSVLNKNKIISNDVKTKTKKQKKKKIKAQANQNNESEVKSQNESNKQSKPNKSRQDYVNPNAITNKDSDSEHESDDEIMSDKEAENTEILRGEEEDGVNDAESSDEEIKEKKPKSKVTEEIEEIDTQEVLQRTIFVGNVLFNKKCKKEIKKIFGKHGHIESVRIRNIPVKDPSVTPKLAVIKNELHSDRTTVNVYVKYSDISSVEKALTENNTVLNGYHLRVSKSSSTGADHDPKCSIFVGNVPFALEDDGLRAKFDKCGEITSIRIIRDRKTNAGKGFGYVNFASKDGVELALALPDEDLTIKNRILRVKRCTQMTQRQLQNKRDKGQNNRDGSRNNRDGSRNNRDGSRNNRDGSRNNRDASRNNRDWSQNNRDRGQNNWDRGQNNSQKNAFRGNQNRNNVHPRNNDDVKGGAFRRVMNKRKMQENEGVPPIKRGRDTDRPFREKKPKKQFMGMTGEKKKKPKFSKDGKKKKALSEILTK